MSQAPSHPPAERPPTAAPDLQIDLQRRLVTLRGEPVKLGGRAFDMLATMVAKPGRVFTADELLQAVWPGRVVEETNLRAQIHKLRQTIGSQRIVNVSGRGYAYAASTDTLAPAPVPAPQTSNLPAPSTELLGRAEDLAVLAQLIASHRLVTLLGAGGIGKTQLALAAARQAQAVRAEGVWWVDLSSLQTADQIALAIAHALGLQPGQLRGSEAGARLGAALAGHEGLLVLDNAEHVAVPLAGLLHGLMPLAPDLSLLVTSQQRLQLAKEQVYRLEPLEPQSALQLLLRRAQAVDHRFRLEPHQFEAATRLCQQLDRLPMALEMAGARLPMLGLQALQQHLGERLRLLGVEVGTAPERQRTLQSALEWSHALLAPDEQAVLRRLSVFAAPFRLDSAQRVAAHGALDEVAVARAVAALVDKSLLQVHAGAGDGVERRWRLLETTRLFAARQLDLHRERGPTEARHAQAMAVLADAAQAAYWVTGDRAWMAAWRADHDDFLLGYDRACAAGDAASASLLGEVLHGEANLTGLYGPVHERIDQALALLPQGGPLARARLWNRTSANAGGGLTKFEAAGRRVQAWRAVGEPMGLARALAQWAAEHERAGDSAMADTVLAELRALEQPHWPPRQRVMGVALAGLNIASLRLDVAMLREAMLSWEALAQQGGLARVAVQAHGNLASIDILQGRPELALPKLQQSVAEYRALGCLIDAGIMLTRQTKVLLMLGDAAAARDLLEQALMTSHDIGALARFCEAGATLALALDQPERAARLLGAATRYSARQIAPASVWEGQALAQCRQRLAERLDAATRQRSGAEGEALEPAEVHGLLLDWLRATR